MATGKISINSYSVGNLVKIDPKSFVSTVYFARVVRYGLIKMINISFSFNTNCTASPNEWVSSFTIPEEYKSISGVQTEVIFDKLRGSNTDGLQARVDGSSLDLIYRIKPTASGELYCTEFVYV